MKLAKSDTSKYLKKIESILKLNARSACHGAEFALFSPARFLCDFCKALAQCKFAFSLFVTFCSILGYFAKPGLQCEYHLCTG
jgi:hypothetical protein